MSLKRSSAGTRTTNFGGGDAGAKVNRQELFEELKKLAASGQVFTPVDLALAIGAGEPQVSRSLLGLAIEGLLEKVEVGKYRSTQAIADMVLADFIKAMARASKVDTTRQRDLGEIARLKQNNDVMRGRLLQAIAERDHYLAALKQRGIDPGPPPAPVAPAPAPAVAVAPVAPAVAAPAVAPTPAVEVPPAPVGGRGEGGV